MTGTIGFLAAFAAGAVSFLSPCVLPLVPGYVSYLAGQSARNPATSLSPRLAAFALGVCFVLGFSMVFILFGAGASALGHEMRENRRAGTPASPMDEFYAALEASPPCHGSS